MPRPPKPSHLKVLQGTFRRDRAKNEPNPTDPLGHPPDHLMPEEADCWQEIADTCPARVLTRADRIAVEIAANLLAGYRRDPEFSHRRLNLLITLLGRFGMTP